MNQASRKRLALASLALVAIAIAGSLAWTFKDRPVESWHLARLGSEEPAKRRNAAEYLSEHRVRKALPILVEQFKRGTFVREESYLVLALSRYGDEGNRAIIENLEGKDLSSLFRIVHALKDAEVPDDAMLSILLTTASRPSCHAGHLSGFSKLLLQSLPGIAGRLEDPNQPAPIRVGAASVLRILGPQARSVAPAVGRIANKRGEKRSIRAAAIKALWNIEDRHIEDKRTRIRLSDAKGAPGDEIALEFRADLHQPVEMFTIEFRFEEDVCEFLRPELTGTEAEGLTPNQIIFLKKEDRRDGERPTGLSPTSSPEGDPPADLIGVSLIGGGDRLIEAGRDQVIIKAVVRIREKARPGSYKVALGLDLVGLTGHGAGVGVRRTGSLEVLDQKPSPRPKISATLKAPPAPTEVLDATPTETGVQLTWKTESAAKKLWLFRNGTLIAELDGSARGHLDPYLSKLYTRYDLHDAESEKSVPLSKTALNASSGLRIRVEIVRAKPGATSVPVKVYLTNSEAIQGFSFSLMFDKARSQVRSVSRDGTSQILGYFDSHFKREAALAAGEVTVGVADLTPPVFRMPPANDLHVQTIVVDVAPDAPGGSIMPIDFGNYGNPPAENIFVVRGGQSADADTVNGAILIGDSPIAEPATLRREELFEAKTTDGKTHYESRGVELRWRNPLAYDSIEIRRDGTLVDTLRGNADSYLDAKPGPGSHRWEIVGKKDKTTSFPAITRWP